jgi:hypothetical protein
MDHWLMVEFAMIAKFPSLQTGMVRQDERRISHPTVLLPVRP